LVHGSRARKIRRGPSCSADDYEVEIRQIFEIEDFAPILSEELPNQAANK
jgi:hypothetical protein